MSRVYVSYIYAILGISLFHNVARTGEFLNDDAHFSSLGVAFLTLFRCSTGGDWNGLMHDTMITEATHPGRCSDAEGTCGSPILAVVFFVSFVICSTYILESLLIAVVIDAFTEDMNLPLNAFLRNVFDDVWLSFDPMGNGWIDMARAEEVIGALPPPLGVQTQQPDSPRPGTTATLGRLRLPVRAGRLYYHDLLERLTLSFTGDFIVPDGVELVSAVQERIAAYRAKTGGELSGLRAEATLNDLKALVRLQRAMRRSLRDRRRMRNSLAGRYLHYVGLRRRDSKVAAFIESPKETVKRGVRRALSSLSRDRAAASTSPSAVDAGAGGASRVERRESGDAVASAVAEPITLWSLVFGRASSSMSWERELL